MAGFTLTILLAGQRLDAVLLVLVLLSVLAYIFPILFAVVLNIDEIAIHRILTLRRQLTAKISTAY